MFANFLIGLREGFEAALIVAILVAYLVRTGNEKVLPRLWAGVGGAIALSIVLGGVLTVIDQELGEKAAEAFAGITSLVAVALITWMIFWMAVRARGIARHLHGQLDKALATSGIAVAAVAFVAVAREGVETALFLWAGIRSSGTTATPVMGAVLGLVTAVVLGVLTYKGAVKLNLGKLFTITGVALIFVAAGVLRYAIHEFQELGWLPGEDNVAIDVSSTFPADGVPATLMRGVFNLTPTMTWLEILAWIAYVVIALVAFVIVIRRRDAGRSPQRRETPDGEPATSAA